MVKVLFVGAKVSALAKVVIGKHAAAAAGIFRHYIAASSKWQVSFAAVKKTVDLSTRSLTLQGEDSSEHENDDTDDVDLSGVVSAPIVHNNLVANGNEDEPNILIECE